MSRKELLNMLLTHNLPLSIIMDKLNEFGWDSDDELVILERQHILNILEKYNEGDIDEVEIEDWANSIEGREDIGREKAYEGLINQILYELANPLLREPLTNDRAKIIISKIS